ncbi:hypothetical protein C8R43DRAFT_1120515 [Mycena crocata]|nr:hypothetical protein C8R43DRAFT_1120515 [Mycena crocata]
MTVLPNDPLAAQLNDLAMANQDGLLNDDEYRLLRQNLFERYSGGVEIVSVNPPPVVKLVSAAPSRRKHVELVDQPSPRAQVTATRSKTSGVAGFFRRATGRKSPSPAPTSAIKLSFIPRMFSKKPDDALASDTDSSGTRHSSSPSLSRKASGGDVYSSPSTKPQGLVPTSPTRPSALPSPIRPNFEAAPGSPSRSTFAISVPSKYDVIPGGSNDIFDDDNLQTSEAIRKAIMAVEAEGRRLVTAFNDLETSAVIRYRQEHPQRQRSGSNAPSHRRPSISPLPSSDSSQHAKSRSRSNSQRHILPNSDAQSVRSSSSLRTSKSTASLLRSASPPPTFSQSTPPPTSAWTALAPRRLPSLRRKGSASSISSQTTNPFLSVGCAAAPGLSRTSSVSRSTGHLPLPVPSHGSGSTMMELLNNTPPGEGGEELTEVRRRRTEMVGRCEARLEYLRAKLKGAELHEKLLKK